MMLKGEDLLYSEISPRGGGVLLYSRSSGVDLLWEMIHYMTPVLHFSFSANVSLQ